MKVNKNFNLPQKNLNAGLLIFEEINYLLPEGRLFGLPMSNTLQWDSNPVLRTECKVVLLMGLLRIPDKNSKNLQPLDIIACNSANKASAKIIVSLI